MSIKLWNWDKKPRTMQRYLKRGDIFCFVYASDIGDIIVVIAVLDKLIQKSNTIAILVL